MSKYDHYTAPGDGPVRPYASGHQNLTLAGLGMPAPRACPAWGCAGPPPRYGGIEIYPVAVRPIPYFPGPGSTSRVPQPPPSSGVSQVVGNPGSSPVASPSPIVGVAPTQTSPQLTQPGTLLDPATGSSISISASGISAWLQESTLISGFSNWEVAGAALVAGWLLLGRRGRR